MPINLMTNHCSFHHPKSQDPVSKRIFRQIVIVSPIFGH